MDGRGTCRRLWAMNLSTGGMFIRTADPLTVGEKVRIEVEWAATVLPLAEGEVVWSREMGGQNVPGFGLRFTRIDPRSARMLETVVKHGGMPEVTGAGLVASARGTAG